MFDLVRERLGPGSGSPTWLASFFINLLTLTAELAGVAIALSLASSVSYLFLIPFVGVPGVAGDLADAVRDAWSGSSVSLGLCLLVFVVAVRIGPDWSHLFHAGHATPRAPTETAAHLLRTSPSRCSARR